MYDLHGKKVVRDTIRHSLSAQRRGGFPGDHRYTVVMATQNAKQKDFDSCPVLQMPPPHTTREIDENWPCHPRVMSRASPRLFLPAHSASLMRRSGRVGPAELICLLPPPCCCCWLLDGTYILALMGTAVPPPLQSLQGM